MEIHPEPKADVYQHPRLDVAIESGDELVIEKKGTRRDVNDMARMGKIQVLRVRSLLDYFELSLNDVQRNFGSYSILAFSMVLMATWAAQLG